MQKRTAEVRNCISRRAGLAGMQKRTAEVRNCISRRAGLAGMQKCTLTAARLATSPTQP